MSSLKRYEGYLMVDHRASPGITEEFARTNGFEGPIASEGKMVESATLTCVHCGTGFVKNPERFRPRAHCKKCDRYVCDQCDHARQQPGYVHRSIFEIADLVHSGRYTLAGTPTAPVLVPTSRSGE
jgi:hypothetical protein